MINCATSSRCSSICHYAQTRLANGLAPVSPLHAAACLAPLKLLVHMHAGGGFENASVLEAVLNGADGAWGGLPKRAAIIGHASLGELIANLVRVGNPHMAQTYQLDQLLPLATGVFRGCPAYSLLGINTCRAARSQARGQRWHRLRLRRQSP